MGGQDQLTAVIHTIHAEETNWRQRVAEAQEQANDIVAQAREEATQQIADAARTGHDEGVAALATALSAAETSLPESDDTDISARLAEIEATAVAWIVQYVTGDKRCISK